MYINYNIYKILILPIKCRSLSNILDKFIVLDIVFLELFIILDFL